MKIIALRKKININFITAGSLAVGLCGIIFLYTSYHKNIQSGTTKIRSDITTINKKSKDLLSKISEVKKYRERWDQIDEDKRKPHNIKVDEVNAQLKKIAEKYSIYDAEVKLTLPEVKSGNLFSRTTISVLFTDVNLSFTSASDIQALMFIDEFIKSLPGYVVTSSVEIKKPKAYSEQDLIALSTGKVKGGISGKVELLWYVYKKKDPNQKEAPPTNSNNSKTKIINNRAKGTPFKPQR
jgi:hypothetical protein